MPAPPPAAKPRAPTGRIILTTPESTPPEAFPAGELLAWFDRSSRTLPWRRDRDPWRIWVSEAMLQQTLVATVIPYFERFIARFPDPKTLAETPEQEVLRYWEGLGYYRRIRHLRQAAILVVETHAGEIPDTLGAFAALPGVGRYMAGAVLSQAFEARLPVLEANTKRVLCRLLAVADDPARPATQTILWAHAEAILPAQRVGDFNQAMMELGALVCSPVSPSCGTCPLAKECKANRDGNANAIPPKKPAPTITAIREVAAMIQHRGKVLFCQRPKHVQWADLWEFPHGEVAEGESVVDAVARISRELTGTVVDVGAELLTVKHGITRYAITLTGFEATKRSGTYRSTFYTASHWLTPTELANYPTSTAQRKLIAEWLRTGRQQSLFG